MDTVTIKRAPPPAPPHRPTPTAYAEKKPEDLPEVKPPRPPEAQAQPAQETTAPPVPIAPAQSRPVANVDLETGNTTATGKPIYGTPGDYYYYLSSGKRKAWTLPLHAMQRRDAKQPAERAKQEPEEERDKHAAARFEAMAAALSDEDMLKLRILRGQIRRGEIKKDMPFGEFVMLPQDTRRLYLMAGGHVTDVPGGE